MNPVKYEFVDGAKSERAAIKISEGNYADLIFAFLKVGLNEIGNECRLYFDYLLIENRELVVNEDEFKEVAGDILVDILENHPSEIGYGNDRDNHSEESGSQ